MTSAPQLYTQAVDALNRAAWPQALALARQLLPMAPNHAGVHFVAGVAALQLRDMQVAVRHLHQAVRLNPQRADYAAQWARALSTGGMLRDAVEAADRAWALSPEDPASLDTLGVVFSQANAHAKAAAAFGEAVRRVPGSASLRFNLATALTATGDLPGAEREYEACIEREPRYWKAHLALAQLRRQRPDAHHIERLESLLPAAAGDAVAQMYLNLALAKEEEDLGRYESSFDHLTAGKAAGRSLRRYSIERDEMLFAALMDAFPEPMPAVAGHDSAEPIFVIGMPRSGTTLVDRILSSHSQVHSAGELQEFGIALKRASGSRTPVLLDPDTVQRALQVDFVRLGEAYINGTRPGTGHTPRFVDKLPHNFLYVGFIAWALPNARIVCLRRDPMDTCLSNFRQLFAQTSPNYDYSFDLLDTGRYFILFDRLMAHWNRVLPGRILEVDYEDLVERQEDATRRLLDFCGLPWEDACLRFERNEAPVATASAVQVREPMHRKSLGRWKRYGDRMASLQALLGEKGMANP